MLADAEAPPDLWTAFTWDPLLLGVLLLALTSYGRGLFRLWRTNRGAGVSRLQAAAFGAGWVALVAALVWPLDAFGGWSLAAHMAQHMILMALAPPLLVVGMAGAVWLAALPAAMARRLGSPLRGHAAGLARNAMVATCVQALVMWGWHLPVAMDAALRHDLVHYAMHFSFLGAGLWFWTTLHGSLREPSFGAGAALIAIVATMMQMGLLSALITFASQPRYEYYLARAPQIGLTALEDQQLAGLIMWVPAALPYLIGGIVVGAVWLRRGERRDATRNEVM